MTEVRAKFKYAGKRSQAVRDRIAASLEDRDQARDAAAREHVLRAGPTAG